MYIKKSEHDKLKQSVKEILWMARRYADGRMTTSASSFNDAYDVLREFFGDDIDLGDATIEHLPYAKDGDDNFNKNIQYRKYYKPEPFYLNKAIRSIDVF